MKNQPEINECEECGAETHRDDHYRCRYCDQYRISKEDRLKVFRLERNEY